MEVHRGHPLTSGLRVVTSIGPPDYFVCTLRQLRPGSLRCHSTHYNCRLVAFLGA